MANVVVGWGWNRYDNGGKSNREHVHTISFVRGEPVSGTRWTSAERIPIRIGRNLTCTRTEAWGGLTFRAF
jgi:V8-like Glu-specific endopeptidase